MDNAGQISHRAIFDRTEWDAQFMRLTGARPGQATALKASIELDPAVARANARVLEIVKADTPVDTGTLQSSIHENHNGPADYSTQTEIHYAPVVESREPGGPAKGKGAMFAQNLDVAEAILAEEIDREIRSRIL